MTDPQSQQRYLDHLAATQQAYAERRIEDYLAGFAPHYRSVQLHTAWTEDKQQLADKIRSDIARFELLDMQFEVIGSWFAGNTGFAHLRYHTRLGIRGQDQQRILVDRRENILVGEPADVSEGEGSGWAIISKIVLRAENYYE
jgi:hypothetical protein